MADVYFKIGYFDPRDNQWHEGQPPVVQQQPQSNQVIAGQSGQSTAYRQPQQVAVGANAPQYYYPQQQVPYTQVQQSTYYNPGGVPTQVALGVPSGPLVRYNYRPQQYNTGMNYGPWYGQQSYATRAPYAPNQPYYETVIGSDGRPRTIRMGEYEQMQPTHYETFYNSQGQLVQVPQYPAVPVRTEPFGGRNQPVASSTTGSVATTPRVRSMPEPVPNQQYIEERNTTSNQRLTNEELNALTGTTTETTYSSTSTPIPTTTTITPTNSDVIPPITEDQAERLRDIYGRDLDVNLFWGWLNSSSDKNSVQRVLNREEVIPDTQVQTFRTLRYPVLSPLGEALRDRLMEEEAQ